MDSLGSSNVFRNSELNSESWKGLIQEEDIHKTAIRMQ